MERFFFFFCFWLIFTSWPEYNMFLCPEHNASGNWSPDSASFSTWESTKKWGKIWTKYKAFLNFYWAWLLEFVSDMINLSGLIIHVTCSINAGIKYKIKYNCFICYLAVVTCFISISVVVTGCFFCLFVFL